MSPNPDPQSADGRSTPLPANLTKKGPPNPKRWIQSGLSFWPPLQSQIHELMPRLCKLAGRNPRPGSTAPVGANDDVYFFYLQSAVTF